MCVRVGDSLTLGDLEDIRRSASLSDGEAVKKNDFLLAMMVRLGEKQLTEIRLVLMRLTWSGALKPGYISPDDTKAILNIFAKLDTNQNGAITDEDVLSDSASNGAAESNGATKRSTTYPARSRDRDLFDEEAPMKVKRSNSKDTTSNPVAVKRSNSKDTTSNPVAVKRSNSKDTTSNPVASSSRPAPAKKAGMVLGDENTGEKVRGADGKVRRKVKKPKKPRAGDEV
jgi:hypothetical protein